MATAWPVFKSISLQRETIQNKKGIDKIILFHYLISPIIEMREEKI